MNFIGLISVLLMWFFVYFTTIVELKPNLQEGWKVIYYAFIWGGYILSSILLCCCWFVFVGV